MIDAFSRAFSQLGDKSLRRVVSIGIIGAIAIFIILWFAVGFLLFNTEIFEFDGMLGMLNKVFEWLTDIFGAALVVFISWLLFPSIVSIVVSFFLEDAARAVEAGHYPGLPAPRRQEFSEVFLVTVKFAGLAILLNILVLPIYAILFFIGPFNLFVFYTLNGYLLGREFFELVAHRRATPEQALHLRGAFRGQLFLAGVVIAFMMTIPILNLIASVIATAAMIHLTQNWRARLESV